MKFSDFSLDLVEEILLRVPATSWKAIQSTCKHWNFLFNDQSFAQKHFLKASKQVLMLKDYKVSLMSVGLEFKDSYSTIGQVNIIDIFHCDGLLLCTTKDYRHVVWNPCSGKTWPIKHNNTPSMKYAKFCLGKDHHGFKILKCPVFYIEEGINNGFEIYDASSGSWRTVRKQYFDSHFLFVSNGVSLKSNIYWCVTSLGGAKSDWLLRFDFTCERFSRTIIHPFRKCNQVTLSVVREEELSALHLSRSELKIEIWVTNKFDTSTETSLHWTQSFTVDLSISPPNFASFLMGEEKKVAFCCSLDLETKGRLIYMIREADKYYRENSCSANKSWCLRGPYEESIKNPFICSYVPSLFQFQQVLQE